jgi:hypothetical protein
MKKIKGIHDTKDYLTLVDTRRLSTRALIVSILAFLVAFVALLLRLLEVRFTK